MMVKVSARLIRVPTKNDQPGASGKKKASWRARIIVQSLIVNRLSVFILNSDSGILDSWFLFLY
jgi:hypothetical protein